MTIGKSDAATQHRKPGADLVGRSRAPITKAKFRINWEAVAISVFLAGYMVLGGVVILKLATFCLIFPI